MLFKKHKFFCLLTFFFCIAHLNGQSFTVSGFVTKRGSGEVIVGAYVYCPQTGAGTVTNNSGYYALSIPYGTKNIMYLSENYAAQIDTTVINKNKNSNVSLRELGEDEAQTNPYDNPTKPQEPIDEDDTTFREIRPTISNNNEVNYLIRLALARNTKIIDRPENGFIEVPGLQISQLPNLGGEVDVVRGIKFLPGVMPGTELTNGLYVRGGGQDQNLMLLDGTPVYNMNHLFGFYSIFNSEGINSINVTKSGYSAKHGGRLSAITDITMKEGDANYTHGYVSQSFVAFNLELNGPLSRDGRTTFALAARRSYLDWFTRLGNSPQNKFWYTLYDINTKISHRFNSKSKIMFNIFSCRDRLYTYASDTSNIRSFTRKDEIELDLNWGNFISSVRLDKVINNQFFSTYTASYSHYRNNFIFNIHSAIDTGTGLNKSEYNYHYYNVIRDFTGKADYSYLMNKTNTLHFGASVSIKGFVPGSIDLEYKSNNRTVNDTNIGGSRVLVGNEYVGYIEDELRLNNNTKLLFGSRFVYYNYQKNNFLFVEPRISLNARINNEYAIKASYTVMNQALHSLENNTSSYITDRWVPATGNIGPQRAHQITLGISKPYENNIELAIEGYYKYMSKVLDVKEGAVFGLIDKNWEDKVLMGKGWCYGIETFIHKRKGDLSGWMSYTLSWATRNTPGINRDQNYYFQFDRRHYVNIVAQQKIDDRHHLSVNMVFSTGNVQSVPIGKYRDINGDIVYDYTAKNNYRLANTFRIDIGFKRIRDNTWGTESGYNFSIYNLLFRNNPAYVYIVNSSASNPDPQAFQRSFLGFIPGISYYTKF
ncbi:MAG: TonB-dependent receptor [Bacteroidota bacterium]